MSLQDIVDRLREQYPQETLVSAFVKAKRDHVIVKRSGVWYWIPF